MKSLQNRIPIMFSVAFGAGIAVLGARAIAEADGLRRWAAVVLIGLYAVWLVVEARVAVGELGKGETALDRGTLELYAFARAATVVAALAGGVPRGLTPLWAFV